MYPTEQKLVAEITQSLQTKEGVGAFFDANHSSKIFEELNLGYGIPDVVVVQYKEIQQRDGYLNLFDVSLLTIIEDTENLSFEDIVYLTRSPKKKVNLSLSALQEQNLIAYREGKYFSKDKYADILEDCIAIEAKLKNWKRALHQAYRYKWFAKKSFVILPSDNIQPAKKQISLFEKYQVGLASLSKTEGLDVLYTPESSEPISKNMNRLLNEHLISDLNSETE